MPFDSVKTGHQKATVEGGFICFIFLGLRYPVSGATTVITTTFNTPQKKYQQKSIPVGCVPSAAVAVGGEEGGVCPGGFGHVGVCPGGVCPGGCLLDIRHCEQND